MRKSRMSGNSSKKTVQSLVSKDVVSTEVSELNEEGDTQDELRYISDDSDLDVEVSDSDDNNKASEISDRDDEVPSKEDEDKLDDKEGKEITIKPPKQKRKREDSFESEYSSDGEHVDVNALPVSSKHYLSFLEKENKQLQSDLCEVKQKLSVLDGFPALVTAMNELVGVVTNTKLELINLSNEIQYIKSESVNLRQEMEYSLQTLKIETNKLTEDLRKGAGSSSQSADLRSVRTATRPSCTSSNCPMHGSSSFWSTTSLFSKQCNLLNCLRCRPEGSQKETISDPIVISDTEEADDPDLDSETPLAIVDDTSNDGVTTNQSLEISKANGSKLKSYSENTKGLIDSDGLQGESEDAEEPILKISSVTGGDASPSSHSEKASLHSTSENIIKKLQLPKTLDLDKYVDKKFNFGGVEVTKEKLKKLTYRKLAPLISELSSILFSPTEMALCTISGRSKNGVSKDRLDPKRIDGIVDYVQTISECKNRSTVRSEVLQALRIKLNNFQKTESAREIMNKKIQSPRKSSMKV